jgi:MoaA/NifB/PqqE/SkfB family radical SAM enzyme
MTDSSLKIAGQLIKNGFRFQYLRYSGKADKPVAVSLELTHDCIAKCIMCNIWRIPDETSNLPTKDWLHLLSSDLFSDLKELDITGGEPFLRKDLPDLIAGICELKNLNNLRSIAITSNGFLTRRVLENAEKILRTLEKAGMDLVMVCAMDAIGPVHDKIRNFRDAWSKVDATLRGLKILRERYPNLIIGLKTTILPSNVGELDGIVQYANDNGFFTIISPCIITSGRYLNPEKEQELVFSPDDIEQMIRFYRQQATGWSYHGDQLITLLRTGTLKKPCSCGFNYFFVRSNGDLFLCPLLDNRVGNIKETPIETLFYSKEAAQIRRRIGNYPECGQCTEPGLERYSLPYEGFAYLALLLRMGREAFLEHHRHMGLDKYFDST